MQSWTYSMHKMQHIIAVHGSWSTETDSCVPCRPQYVRIGSPGRKAAGHHDALPSQRNGRNSHGCRLPLLLFNYARPGSAAVAGCVGVLRV
jgi:hypothetical protein